MADALGFMLPAAFAAIAFSLPAVVVMILLIEPGESRGNAWGFASGWIVSFLAVCGAFLVAADVLNSDQSDERSNWVAVLLLILGVALVGLGIRKVVERPLADQPVEQSSLMKAVEGLTAARAVLLGVMMGGVNPKFLAVIGSLAAELTLTDATGAEQVLVMLAFTVIGSAGVLGPLVAVQVAGERAQVVLGRLRGVLDAYTWLIMAVIFGYFGITLIGDALQALT